MAYEVLVNNATTTLSSGITNSATSIPLTDATAFPATGNYRIIIDNEIMKVTSKSGSNLTVVRGAESTTAVTHSSGAAVNAIVTKEGLETFRNDLWFKDVIANIPAAAINGRLFWATDNPLLYFDDGTNFLATYGEKYTKPNWTSYSFTNNHAGGAAVVKTDKGSYSLFSCPGTGGSTVQPTYVKTIPNASLYKITVCFDVLMEAVDFPNFGLVVVNGTSGAHIVWGLTNSTNLLLSIDYYSNNTTYSSTPKSQNFTRIPQPIRWFQIEDDGTTRYFRFSRNGIDFHTFFSHSRTSLVTPDQYGILAMSGNSTVTMEAALYSLLEQ